MPIDFTYRSLRENIIKSYTSGDFRNDNNQLNLSLHYLDMYYRADDFKDLENFIVERRKLLFRIQAAVDSRLGMDVYNRGE